MGDQTIRRGALRAIRNAAEGSLQNFENGLITAKAHNFFVGGLFAQLTEEEKKAMNQAGEGLPILVSLEQMEEAAKTAPPGVVPVEDTTPHNPPQEEGGQDEETELTKPQEGQEGAEAGPVDGQGGEGGNVDQGATGGPEDPTPPVGGLTDPL